MQSYIKVEDLQAKIEPDYLQNYYLYSQNIALRYPKKSDL